MDKASQFPDMQTEAGKCEAFLRDFEDRYGDDEGHKYMDMLKSVANRESTSMNIDLGDLEQHNPELARSVQQNTRRYQGMLAAACDKLMPEPSSESMPEEIADVWLNQRKQRHAAVKSPDDMSSLFPTELTRRFEMRLVPKDFPEGKNSNLRDIKAKDVGKLVSVKGIVTRVSDVQPLARVVAYICQTCGYESYQTVPDKSFTPLTECPSEVCRQNQTQGELYQQTRGSKFVKYQEIRLQELPHEVPVGHIPRSITLKVYGDLTRQCKPGSIITVAGIFLPTRYTGFRAIRAGLTADTYLEVTALEAHKKNYADFTLSAELSEEVERRAEDKDIFDNLAVSIAPEIFGHEDIKKALVLLLVGGVTKEMPDGMKIRGDINVLLCGDPGVAKSQLLKHICTVAPRGVYTTGKGSSGVGLTAAVTRDPITNEMMLEGGALVLADKGICAIDEFDKMEDADRTAIHEVMEQQTVSIAKAGITTTLNARTSILAAANPVYGRYKKSKTVEQNLGLPAALLSRFDLTFIILDQPDESFDESLARHVTHVHRNDEHPPLEFEPFTSAFLRAYVSKARQFQPWIPKELTEYIVGSYVSLRSENEDEAGSMSDRRQRFCTARSLLGILRLSQALARVHFRDVVEKEDVEEALRLLEVCKSSALADSQQSKKIDPVGAIYSIIKRMSRDQRNLSVRRQDVLTKCVHKGYSEEQLEQCISTYQDLGVWTLTKDGLEIRLLPNANR